MLDDVIEDTRADPKLITELEEFGLLIPARQAGDRVQVGAVVDERVRPDRGRSLVDALARATRDRDRRTFGDEGVMVPTESELEWLVVLMLVRDGSVIAAQRYL